MLSRLLVSWTGAAVAEAEVDYESDVDQPLPGSAKAFVACGREVLLFCFVFSPVLGRGSVGWAIRLTWVC